jgi:hypothetical protein
MTKLQLLAAGILWTTLCAPLIAREWPEPALPADSQLSLVGEAMEVNGMPVRIFRFETRRTADEVIAGFGKSVRGSLRESSLPGGGSGRAIAGRSGHYWITLQLSEDGWGTRGTWSASPQFEQRALREIRRPVGFPERAQLLQQVDSFDMGKRSQLVVGMDSAGIDAVAQEIEATLRGAGFQKSPFVARSWTDADNYTAIFARAREEIMVSLRRDTQGTSIVLNRLSALETLK